MSPSRLRACALVVAFVSTGCGALLGVDFGDARWDAADGGLPRGVSDAVDAAPDPGDPTSNDASPVPGACKPDDTSDCRVRCGQMVGRCGAIVDCGACPSGESCGGGGTNRCGTLPCVPSCVGKACGGSDGCGEICTTGACGSGLSCSGGACVGTTTATKLVLFSGSGAGAGDTWEWNGSTWTQRNVTGPAARLGHAMASLRGKAVLAGGYGATTSFKDTWTWDGVAWVQAADMPVTRYYHTMVGLPSSVALFEGSETSEWDGTRWTVSGATGPSRRFDVGLAALGGKIVLFGGGEPVGGSSNRIERDDTWSWFGGAWTQLPATGPSARAGHAMATLGAKVVLFGGEDASGANLADTWEWDGVRWTNKAVAGPPARRNAAMATLGSKVVLFGGTASTNLADTWEWDGAAWTKRSVAGPSPRYLSAMAAF